MIPARSTFVLVSLLATAALAAAPESPPAASTESAGVSASTATPLDLSLGDAIDRGLRENLAALTAAGKVEEAEGGRARALARLLPQVYGTLGESRQKINLEAYGFPPPDGGSPLVGPFNVVDARAHFAQILLDLSAMAEASAARRLVEASRASYREARDRVVSAVAELYLASLASEARIESARAQVATAETIERLAKHQKEVGKAAGIDVLRAQVTLATERQREIEAVNESAKLELQLAQAIGLPLERKLRLTDRIGFAPLELADLDAALAEAKSGRPDLAAAHLAVAAAESGLAAARRERLPTIGVQADWGPIGPTPATAQDTYSVGGGLRLPLFEGGRIAGDVRAARGRLDESRARLADLDRRVELEVRTAYLDVAAAGRQVGVADQARDLASRQLVQAQDRFAAGVADNLEVVQAQESVAAASDRYVTSLFAYNRAKVALAQALGVAEPSAARFLKGDVR